MADSIPFSTLSFLTYDLFHNVFICHNVFQLKRIRPSSFTNDSHRSRSASEVTSEHALYTANEGIEQLKRKSKKEFTTYRPKHTIKCKFDLAWIS